MASQSNYQEQKMCAALQLAKEAYEQGEIPVGCIITDRNGIIIGKGRNRRESMHDATAHAEIEAIKEACAAKKDWRLDDCTIYITLEPCPMCMGAIINARIPNVVFGARDKETGSCGSVIDLLFENYHHKAVVYSSVLENESAALLKEFFHEKRK